MSCAWQLQSSLEQLPQSVGAKAALLEHSFEYLSIPSTSFLSSPWRPFLTPLLVNLVMSPSSLELPIANLVLSSKLISAIQGEWQFHNPQKVASTPSFRLLFTDVLPVLLLGTGDVVHVTSRWFHYFFWFFSLWPDIAFLPQLLFLAETGSELRALPYPYQLNVNSATTQD